MSKELINRIVALGGILRANSMSWHLLDFEGDVVAVFTSEKEAYASWKLAGALMEKRCAKEDVDLSCGRQDGKWWAAIEDFGDLYFSGEDESLPHAIILACIEALEAA